MTRDIFHPKNGSKYLEISVSFKNSWEVGMLDCAYLWHSLDGGNWIWVRCARDKEGVFIH